MTRNMFFMWNHLNFSHGDNKDSESPGKPIQTSPNRDGVTQMEIHRSRSPRRRKSQSPRGQNTDAKSVRTLMFEDF